MNEFKDGQGLAVLLNWQKELELDVGSCSFHPTTRLLGMVTRASQPCVVPPAVNILLQTFYIPQRSTLTSGVITK